MTEFTTYEQVGDVALISMDDGKAYAFGPPMIAAVNARLDRAADDAKGVVLSGRPGIFSGGFELNVIRSGDAAQARAMPAFWMRSWRLTSCPTSRSNAPRTWPSSPPRHMRT